MTLQPLRYVYPFGEMGIDLSPGGSVALGVIVGLLSTSIQSVGLTLQRKSHLLEEEKEEQDPEYYERRPPYKRRRWQIGMSMFLIANLVGSTIQITTLPLPVLSTLQASGLVFNTACATILLHEPFTRYSVIGTLLVVAGAILIAIYGSLTEPSHNLTQLLTLLGRPNFLLWLFGTFFIVVLIAVGLWILDRLYPRPSLRIRLIRGMLCGAISGILSAHCLLVAKSAVELLVRTIADHSNQFNRWQSWMILLGLVVLALLQLYYLHRGLKLCSTSILYPFVFCVYNIIAILDGLIYFDQTDRITVKESLLIALGTAILLAGVFALSWRLSDQPMQLQRDQGEAIETVKWLDQRIPTPQSALEPGFGLIPAANAVSAGDEDEFLRPGDDEEALRRPYRALTLPSERTPLLRTSTSPMWGRSLTPQKRRRLSMGGKARRQTMGVAEREEVSDIWDELNDRGGEGRRVSFANPNSPSSSRSFSRAKGKKRAETMPSVKPSSGVEAFLNLPWVQWKDFGRLSLKRADTGRSEDPPAPVSEPDETDGEEGEPSVAAARNTTSWGMGSRRTDATTRRDADRGWFKLRWFKRRLMSQSESSVDQRSGIEGIEHDDTT